MSQVFLALQNNEETRPVIEAVLEDNPHAKVEHYPAMVRIVAPDELIIRQATISEKMGRDWDMQELHVHLITLTGHVEEEDEFIRLYWQS